MLTRKPRAGAGARILLLTACCAAAAAPLAAQWLPAEDAALLLSGRSGGLLRLQTRAVPVESLADGGSRVRVVLELDLAGVAGGTAPITLFWGIYAIDAEGSLAGSALRSATTTPERLAASGAVGLRIFETLELASGEYSIRSLVRRVGSRSFGLRSIPLSLPESQQRLALFVPRRTHAWLEIGADAAAILMPAALATVRADRKVRIVVRGSKGMDLSSWELVPGDASGDTLTVSADSGSAPNAHGDARAQTVRLHIPEDLQGLFRVRPTSTANAAGAPLLVVAADAETLAWPAALRRFSLIERAPLTPDQTRPRSHQEIRRGLLEALRTVAGKGVRPGAKALTELFRKSWTASGSEGLQAFVSEAQFVTTRLVRAAPQSALPVVAAVAVAMERCLEAQRLACANGMGRLQTTLLQAAAEAGAEAQPVTAAAWAVLGWRLLQSSLFHSAEEALRTACDWDPELPACHLTLGMLYERLGDYRSSARVLTRILQQDPSLTRARLRRAIQWRRFGRDRAALRELEKSTRKGPRWIRIVAFQELASLTRDRQGVEAAIPVLREGLAEFPEEEQLILQLAAMLELSGNSAAAEDLLARLGAPPAGPSARGRYDKWPQEVLRQTEQTLLFAAQKHRAELGAALDSLPS